MKIASISVIVILFNLVCGLPTSPLWKQINLVITELETGTMEIAETQAMFSLHLRYPVEEPATFVLSSEKRTVAFPLRKYVTFYKHNSTTPTKIYVYGKGIGDTDILVGYNDTPSMFLSERHERVHVLVVHSLPIKYLSIAVGWIYFFAWAVSNYPQVYINFKRRSVVGLNFDYISYNITGFVAYSVFNVALYWIPTVQDQYFAKYGGSVIPVQLNDVFFGLHNTFITSVVIVQALLYDKGSQRISKLCYGLVAVLGLFCAASLVPAVMGKITWLMYLNFYSYIKLVVTVIKYMPQVYMNYARKSTVGWSVAFVILDLVGGVFSVLQMFFISYNNNEWNSIFGDFTKIGLGLMTLIFDAIFLTQHYILYKDALYTNTEEELDEKL